MSLSKNIECTFLLGSDTVSVADSRDSGCVSAADSRHSAFSDERLIEVEFSDERTQELKKQMDMFEAMTRHQDMIRQREAVTRHRPPLPYPQHHPNPSMHRPRPPIQGPYYNPLPGTSKQLPNWNVESELAEWRESAAETQQLGGTWLDTPKSSSAPRARQSEALTPMEVEWMGVGGEETSVPGSQAHRVAIDSEGKLVMLDPQTGLPSSRPNPPSSSQVSGGSVKKE